MDYTLTLTGDDLTVISSALQEVPFKYAAPVMNKISAQADAQNKAATEPPLAPAELPAE